MLEPWGCVGEGQFESIFVSPPALGLMKLVSKKNQTAADHTWECWGHPLIGLATPAFVRVEMSARQGFQDLKGTWWSPLVQHGFSCFLLLCIQWGCPFAGSRPPHFPPQLGRVPPLLLGPNASQPASTRGGWPGNSAPPVCLSPFHVVLFV